MFSQINGLEIHTKRRSHRRGPRHVFDRRIPCDLREHHRSRPGGSSPTQPGQMKPIRALYESGKAETIEILSRKLGGGRGRSVWRLHHTRARHGKHDRCERFVCLRWGFFIFFLLLLRFDSPKSNKKKLWGPREASRALPEFMDCVQRAQRHRAGQRSWP